jgi:hypothetical protein
MQMIEKASNNTRSRPVIARRWMAALCALGLLAAGCRDSGAAPGAVTVPTEHETAVAAEPDASTDGVTVVVAPGVSGSIDESLIRQAFRRVVAQGEQDFGLRPERTVTVYIDPDSAIGLEDALGLSQKYAIHLRAGRARSMAGLLPLMMHEYTHVLQYQMGRLRPQWWIEGQADHQALRVRDPASAERERRSLYSRLADDVRAGRAPELELLRGSLAWDAYVRKAGAGKAYGWGNAAVAFIESRAGFAGVARVMTDAEGQNTFGRFDEVVREVTGLGPSEFDDALKRWVTQQARG